jgi:hypothetical protein
MTSWIRGRAGPPRQPRAELDVFWTTNTNGFCSQFNQYFYHAYYARRIGKEVQVLETPNCISATHPLLSTTFADVSGVRFVTARPDEVSQRQHAKVFDTVTRTAPATLRAAAREILAWNPGLEGQLRGILATTGMPAAFDLVVHIRTGDKVAQGEMKSIQLERYIRAIEEVQPPAVRGIVKPLQVLVMADNATVLEQLKKRVKGAYQFYSLASTHASGGHRQEEFNARSTDDKFSEMMIFLLELYLAQRCPAVICTLSSNVGRFLWLTGSARVFKSLDVTDFVPL